MHRLESQRRLLISFFSPLFVHSTGRRRPTVPLRLLYRHGPGSWVVSSRRYLLWLCLTTGIAAASQPPPAVHISLASPLALFPTLVLRQCVLNIDLPGVTSKIEDPPSNTFTNHVLSGLPLSWVITLFLSDTVHPVPTSALYLIQCFSCVVPHLPNCPGLSNAPWNVKRFVIPPLHLNSSCRS